MRKIPVGAIKGNEMLARDLYSLNDKMLLPAGTKIKKEYINHLRQLEVAYIYVEDELSYGVVDDEGTESVLSDRCMRQVRETLNRFIYNGRSQAEELARIIGEIIKEVLTQKEVIYSLSGVRQKSEQLYCHSISVCTLSVLITLKMDLPRAKVKEIALGGILHDIGYKCVSVDMHHMDEKVFSEEEHKELKKHVIYGYNLVEKETWLPPTAKEIIIAHHELCDKSGYPFRLDEAHMKLHNKIVSLCDTFDRLVYGYFTKPMKVHEAIEYIVNNQGKKFANDMVAIFIKSLAAYPNGSIVRTNEQQMGIVLHQNHNFPSRPVIRIIRDAKGRKCDEWIIKDLTKNLTLFIEDTIEIM